MNELAEIEGVFVKIPADIFSKASFISFCDVLQILLIRIIDLAPVMVCTGRLGF